MSWTGAIFLAAVAVSLCVFFVRRRHFAQRRPTPPMEDMDHAVPDRIRAISAASRYSSAGLEL